MYSCKTITNWYFYSATYYSIYLTFIRCTSWKFVIRRSTLVGLYGSKKKCFVKRKMSLSRCSSLYTDVYRCDMKLKNINCRVYGVLHIIRFCPLFLRMTVLYVFVFYNNEWIRCARVRKCACVSAWNIILWFPPPPVYAETGMSNRCRPWEILINRVRAPDRVAKIGLYVIT